MKSVVFALMWILSSALTVSAQTYAIRNARIVPGSGPAIASGTILIQDGRIMAIGANIPVPGNAKVLDARGLTAYPGMIDPYTTLGLAEIGAISATMDTSELGDLNPQIKASAALNPHSEHIPVTRTNGITTAIVAPRGGLFGGQAAIVNLDGWVTREMIVRDGAASIINFPREVEVAANTPDRQRQDREQERKRRIDLLKKTLRDAQAFAKVIDAGKESEPNLMLRSLVPVVKGDLMAMFVADTALEIRESVAVIEEFKLRAAIVGGKEAGKVVDVLKGKSIPVMLGAVADLPRSDADPYDSLYSTAATLHKEGIRFAFTTGDSAHVRDLPFLAGMAAAFGLPKEEALKAVTVYPAEILGVGGQVGSLAEGKIANIMLTDGDPLEIRTQVRHLFIAGKPVALTNRHTELADKFSKRPQQ